ncbi:uncharacterized protein BYT42DRAFT_592087 [Radiomyces spectabilis]|uniref:uncharacterized protein n=1 Tax=Radiomyces spectabilis TaxID=64574 RepID=UPI00221EBE9A|nr:uncharacterized protein BYT42DRAFT_592087 [Radiomyces spectabilis]KAI8391733.1 hypothetical protein BYT42DRAFT_592087 [Radiomyces spectabilis]
MTTKPQLISDLMLPELERQLAEDPSLWPNVKGNELKPLITADEELARGSAKGKVRTVKIQVEDNDLLNFITGGMTGVKAYMTGKIKVRGDLILAQRLEEVFEKAGGRDRALEFIKKNEEVLALAQKSKL